MAALQMTDQDFDTGSQAPALQEKTHLHLRLLMTPSNEGPLVLPVQTPVRQPDLLPGQASPLLNRCTPRHYICNT